MNNTVEHHHEDTSGISLTQPIMVLAGLVTTPPLGRVVVSSSSTAIPT